MQFPTLPISCLIPDGYDVFHRKERKNEETLEYFLMISLVLGCTLGARAANSVVAAEELYYVMYNESGEITGYNMPKELNTVRAEDGTYLKTTRVSSGSRSNVYCGIHPDTPMWRRVATYYFTTSRTVSMSISMSYGGESFGGSIGVSAETSQGFGFTINVDQNRDSKLKVYCDYDYVLYRGEIRDIYTDQLYQTFQYGEFTKTAERFIPYYR